MPLDIHPDPSPFRRKANEALDALEAELNAAAPLQQANTLAAIQAQLAGLAADVGALRADVGALRADVGTLSARLDLDEARAVWRCVGRLLPVRCADAEAIPATSVRAPCDGTRRRRAAARSSNSHQLRPRPGPHPCPRSSRAPEPRSAASVCRPRRRALSLIARAAAANARTLCAAYGLATPAGNGAAAKQAMQATLLHFICEL